MTDWLATRNTELRGLPNEKQTGSNPFSIFRNTITNPAITDALEEVYGSPDSHIDLFPARISE